MYRRTITNRSRDLLYTLIFFCSTGPSKGFRHDFDIFTCKKPGDHRDPGINYASLKVYSKIA